MIPISLSSTPRSVMRSTSPLNLHVHPANGFLTRTGFLVDAHVHFHECFTWQSFLKAAIANAEVARREFHATPDLLPCLMMTESAGSHAFRSLRDQPRLIAGSGWSVDDAHEPNSLLLRHAAGASILLIAGRQIVTAENIEVLALGVDADFPDGRPSRQIIDEVYASGAVAVLPWGFGKWWFARGRLVRKLIEAESQGNCVFVGDNSSRPNCAFAPPLFRAARSRKIFLLPGSDPLPFANQVSNVARYGLLLPGRFVRTNPAAQIIEALRALDYQPRIFGSRERLWRFVGIQVAMQLQKRRIRTSS